MFCTWHWIIWSHVNINQLMISHSKVKLNANYGHLRIMRWINFYWISRCYVTTKQFSGSQFYSQIHSYESIKEKMKCISNAFIKAYRRPTQAPSFSMIQWIVYALPLFRLHFAMQRTKIDFLPNNLDRLTELDLLTISVQFSCNKLQIGFLISMWIAILPATY